MSRARFQSYAAICSLLAPKFRGKKKTLSHYRITAPKSAPRTLRNLDALNRDAASAPAVTLPIPEGGWYASLRVPAVRHSEEWALLLLEQESVYVHPGSSFGFAVEAYLVLSLLTPEDAFDDGVRRILRAARRE